MVASIVRGAIMGMACTYSKDDVTPFVKSLLSTGYTGAVHMGIDVAADEAPWFDAHRISHHPEPCKEQLQHADTTKKRAGGKGIWLGTLNQRRWYYYKQWLSLGQYDAVWLTDVRDVVFQTQPFTTRPPELVLYVDKPFLTPFQMRKIKPCLGADVWSKMKASGMPNLCGGTVMGSAAGVAGLCDGMTKLAEEASHHKKDLCIRNDQHLLNYYAFTHNIIKVGANNKGVVMVYARYEGVAINAGSPCDADEHWGSKCNYADRPCVLVNKAQAPISVIHKWDRCKELRKLVDVARDGAGIYKGYDAKNFPIQEKALYP